MLDALLQNAQQHGVAAADYVVAKLRGEGMKPGRASELLNAYVLKQANDMMTCGTSREDLIEWIRAVEAAFDERFAGHEPHEYREQS
jgi:hypothetical protein